MPEILTQIKTVNKLFIGIDLHKNISTFSARTQEGESVLADLLRGNLLPETYSSPKEARGWKEQYWYRASLFHLRTQVKNKVHTILFKHSLKHNFSNLFGRGGRA